MTFAALVIVTSHIQCEFLRALCKGICDGLPWLRERNSHFLCINTNNTMKRTSLFLMLAFTSNVLIAQVDMYEISTHENVNVKKNINQNIHVGGAIYENKTVTTIDYGALAEANANMQRLQFERQQYEDEKQRRMALEMAANPLKAYDYGQNGGIYTTTGKAAEQFGF